MRLSRIAVLSLLVAAGGCRMSTAPDHCDPVRIETFTVDSVLAPDGRVLATTTVGITEIEGDSVPAHLWLGVFGQSFRSPLDAHVRSASLIDDAGRHVHDFDLVADSTTFTHSDVVLRDPAIIADLRTRIAAGGAILLLRTDLPGLAEIRTRLPPSAAPSWRREFCYSTDPGTSYT